MKYAIMFLIATTGIANAESNSLNLSLPTTPGNYQSDKFRAGELDCSNAIGSATNMEFGVTGIIANGSNDINNSFNDSRVGDVGVFARITIPLGARPKNRIDCNRLFELELRTKELELLKLQRELDQLKQLTFED
jgi:hypothetical protein